MSRPRSDRCYMGHPYTDKNTWMRRDDHHHPVCRICAAANSRRYRQAKEVSK